jgi:hypothetical protein
VPPPEPRASSVEDPASPYSSASSAEDPASPDSRASSPEVQSGQVPVDHVQGVLSEIPASLVDDTVPRVGVGTKPLRKQGGQVGGSPREQYRVTDQDDEIDAITAMLDTASDEDRAKLEDLIKKQKGRVGKRATRARNKARKNQAATRAQNPKKKSVPDQRDARETTFRAIQAQTCSVCFVRPISMAFVPCGHMCLCMPCSMTMHHTDQLRKCAVCGVDSTSTIKIWPAGRE